MSFDNRKTLTRQGITSANHSPLLKREWDGQPDTYAFRQARETLAFANRPKDHIARENAEAAQLGPQGRADLAARRAFAPIICAEADADDRTSCIALGE